MSQIIDQISAAVAARKDSLAALRSRLADLLGPIPAGVILSDDAGVVCRAIRICTGASQWRNRPWDVTIIGVGYLSVGGRLVAEKIDRSHWDGRNHHKRTVEPTCTISCGGRGEPLDWESGGQTRIIAARLPAAIANYLAECEAERAANEATAAAL